MNNIKRYGKGGLSFHFVSRLIVMSCLLAAVIIYILINLQKQMIMEEHMEFAISVAENLAANSEYGFITGDREILQSLINGIKKEKDVLYAAIVEKGDDISQLAEYNELKNTLPVIKEDIDKTRTAIRKFGKRKIIIDVVSPIMLDTILLDEDSLFFDENTIHKTVNSDEVLGYVRLGISLEKHLTDVEQTNRKIIFLLILLIAAFAVYQYLQVKNIVIIPLQKINKGAEEFGKGNLDYKVEVTFKNEIGELADAFNLAISERKKSAEALRNIEAQTRSLIDNSPSVIFIKDTSGKHILVNKHFASLFDMKQEDIIGKTIYDLFTKEVADSIKEKDQLVLKTKKPIEYEEKIEISGQERTYFSIKFPLLDSNGVPYALCGITTDITDRKTAEDTLRDFTRQLVESQESERKRIAGELHDSLAQDLLVITNEIKAYIKSTSASQEELTSLIQASNLSIQVLDKIREISYDLRPAQIDKLGFSKGVDSLVGRLSTSSGISISTDIKLGNFKIPPDIEINIFRIIQEGLNNVIKHSEAHSSLVKVLYKNKMLYVHISDDGKGFDPDFSSHARSLKRGYGLRGMTERVKLVGGDFVVESLPNKGTTLKISIPV